MIHRKQERHWRSISAVRALPEAYELYRSLLGTAAADWQLHYELAQVEYQLGQPHAALTRLKHTVSMADGRYVRSYPVVLALVLYDVDSALWFAQQVDEGERYLPLLQRV